MLSTTLAASCSFMLPIGTTTNLVVFATKQVPLKDMIIAGIVLNVISSLVIMFTTYVIMPKVLDIDDIEEYPDWALAAAVTRAQQTSQPGW